MSKKLQSLFSSVQKLGLFSAYIRRRHSAKIGKKKHSIQLKVARLWCFPRWKICRKSLYSVTSVQSQKTNDQRLWNSFCANYWFFCIYYQYIRLEIAEIIQRSFIYKNFQKKAIEKQWHRNKKPLSHKWESLIRTIATSSKFKAYMPRLKIWVYQELLKFVWTSKESLLSRFFCIKAQRKRFCQQSKFNRLKSCVLFLCHDKLSFLLVFASSTKVYVLAENVLRSLIFNICSQIERIEKLRHNNKIYVSDRFQFSWYGRFKNLFIKQKEIE